MLLAKIQRQRGKKIILSNFDATKTMYVQIHLLLLTKVVSRRFKQNLCQSCGKVATNIAFALYFNVNFMTSQRRQYSSDFDEITFIQQIMSLRSYSYQIHAQYINKYRDKEGKKIILSNFDATKTMYVQIHLLLLTKVVSRRFKQNLCQSCGKVATNIAFALYFNVNFMTSQRRQYSSDFDEITFIQQIMSLRSYSYQIHALL